MGCAAVRRVPSPPERGGGRKGAPAHAPLRLGPSPPSGCGVRSGPGLSLRGDHVCCSVQEGSYKGGEKEGREKAPPRRRHASTHFTLLFVGDDVRELV